MSTPNSIPAFGRWLTAEIKALDVDYEPDEQQFHEAAATIREARRIAISLDRPDVAEVCRKVRTNALAFTTAQSILAECRVLLKAGKPVDFLTPPQAAKRLGVSRDKVLGWIRSGELKASNVANTTATRPRYRITADAITEFEKRRSVEGLPGRAQGRRRKQPATVTQYY